MHTPCRVMRPSKEFARYWDGRRLRGRAGIEVISPAEAANRATFGIVTQYRCTGPQAVHIEFCRGPGEANKSQTLHLVQSFSGITLAPISGVLLAS